MGVFDHDIRSRGEAFDLMLVKSLPLACGGQGGGGVSGLGNNYVSRCNSDTPPRKRNGVYITILINSYGGSKPLT